MPYSGENDPDLPERIQKMPAKKRRAFVGAFNQTMKGCKDDPKECERKAFAIANNAANQAGEKDMGNIQLEPEAANYNPVGMNAGQACAACRWFIAPMACYLVEDTISPTGLCDFFLAPEMEMEDTVIEADEEQKAQIKGKDFAGYTLPAHFELTGQSGFKVLANEVLPGTDWIGWYTNAYKDRDGEYFLEGQMPVVVERMQKGIDPMPELWFWHMGKQTRHGQAQWVVKAGRFLVAGGTFDSTPQAQSFKAFYEQFPCELSHGFTYKPEDYQNKVYQDWKTFEISTIPSAAGKAANPYTAFIEGETTMQGFQFSTEQAAFLEKAIGKEAAQKILDAGQKASDALDAVGVAYKQEGDSEPTLKLSQVKELLLMQKADDMGKRLDSMEKRMAKMEEAMTEDKMAGYVKKAMEAMKPTEKPEAEKSRRDVADEAAAKSATLVQDYAVYQQPVNTGEAASPLAAMLMQENTGLKHLFGGQTNE